jgi:hypothetical protein
MLPLSHPSQANLRFGRYARRATFLQPSYLAFHLHPACRDLCYIDTPRGWRIPIRYSSDTQIQILRYTILVGFLLRKCVSAYLICIVSDTCTCTRVTYAVTVKPACPPNNRRRQKAFCWVNPSPPKITVWILINTLYSHTHSILSLLYRNKWPGKSHYCSLKDFLNRNL